MIRNTARMVWLATALVASACASSGGASADGTARVRRDPNEITREELAEPSVASLSTMDAIQRLRPTWLRSRGATSVSGASDVLPAVMLNESLQSLDALRSLPASDVSALRFISASDATTLYGTGYVNGMIKVSTGARQ